MPRRPHLSEFQAVLFDVDGTLIDSLYCITQGLGDAIEVVTGDRPEDSELRKLVGLPLLRQMSIYARNPYEIERMTSHAMERMMFHKHEERQFDAAVETLKFCSQRGIKTALVTSKNSLELSTFIETFEASRYVDATVCASDVSEPKPSPESAYLACKRLRTEPQHCAFVGDSIYDMRCGKSAGMTCIAVAYGAGDKDALIAENPQILFDSPEELLAWAHEPSPVVTCPERN